MRIGIIGGAGPVATIAFQQRLLEKFAQAGAMLDDEYPEFIVTNIPMKNGDSDGDFDKESIQGVLEESINILNFAHCDLAILNCNSIHPYVPKKPSVPIVNNVATIEKLAPTNTPVLASEHSRLNNFWELPPCPIELQPSINYMIKSVMKNNIEAPIPHDLILWIKNLPPNSTIVLGCTELTVFIEKLKAIQSDLIIIDTVELITSMIFESYTTKETNYEIFA